MIMGWISCLISIPVPLVKHAEAFCALIWFMIFFGAFTVPVGIGCMLNSVPFKMRSSANSIAQFSYNAFGYMPAPFIYGTMSQFIDNQNNNTKNKLSAIPMMCIVYFTFIGMSVFT